MDKPDRASQGEVNVLRPQWKQQPPDPDPGKGPMIRAAIPLVIVLGLIVWVLSDREEGAISSPYADMAIVKAPRVTFSDSLPESAESGMMDLARGDCQTAAAHFRTAARRNPDQPKVRMLEGASWLCAGNAGEARQVLEPLSEDPKAPPQTWWYLAQACLLRADADCAALALGKTVELDPRHRESAKRQKRQLAIMRQ